MPWLNLEPLGSTGSILAFCHESGGSTFMVTHQVAAVGSRAMELRDVMAALPARSPYREIVRDLLFADAETRYGAYQRLTDLRRPRDEKDQRTRLPPEVARTLLDAAVSLRFPPQKRDWHDTAHKLIFGLLDSPHASLVEPAARAYLS